MKALENIKVLDLTVALAGPFCTQMLAAQGAEVINVDPPGGGYAAKVFGSLPPELQKMINGSVFANKKGVSINLKTEEGRKLVLELIDKVDVVVSNFSPGTMDRLGLSYEVVHKRNPKVVYCVVSGFGQSGPLRDRSAYDPIVQAMTGIMSINGFPDRDPIPVVGALADVASGMYAAYGILAALHARDTLTGEGQMVDVAMYDCCMSFLQNDMATSLFKQKAKGPGNPYEFAVPVGNFKTREGKSVYLLCQTDKQCNTVMELAGRSDIAEKGWHLKERMKNREEIDAVTAAWIKEHTREEGEQILLEKGIPAAPVLDLLEVAKHPHTAAREMLNDLPDGHGNTIRGNLGVVPKLLGTPGKQEWGMTGNGFFNEEIFGGLLGKSRAEIQQLKESGVI